MTNLKNKDFYNEMVLSGELDEISKEETEAFINFFIKQSSKITYQIISNKKINNNAMGTAILSSFYRRVRAC